MGVKPLGEGVGDMLSNNSLGIWITASAMTQTAYYCQEVKRPSHRENTHTHKHTHAKVTTTFRTVEALCFALLKGERAIISVYQKNVPRTRAKTFIEKNPSYR